MACRLHCLLGRAGFPRLQRLSLEGCEGASSLAPLSALTGLTALSLKRCPNVTGLRHLAGGHCLSDGRWWQQSPLALCPVGLCPVGLACAQYPKSDEANESSK